MGAIADIAAGEKGMSYVMLGANRIDCQEEYLMALGLVEGQTITREIVDDMNKLSDAAFNRNVQAITNIFNSLCASHAELLSAAKEAMHPESTRGMTVDCYNKLQIAVAHAEEIAP